MSPIESGVEEGESDDDCDCSKLLVKESIAASASVSSDMNEGWGGRGVSRIELTSGIKTHRATVWGHFHDLLVPLPAHLHLEL